MSDSKATKFPDGGVGIEPPWPGKFTIQGIEFTIPIDDIRIKLIYQLRL